MTMRADERTRRFDWRRAILEAELPPLTKLVAFVLSMHMSRAGDSCFPGLLALTAQTGMSRSAVQEHLLALITRGWLRRQLHAGRGHTTEYVATFPPAVVDAIVAEAQAPPETPATRALSAPPPGEEKARQAGPSGPETPTKGPPGDATYKEGEYGSTSTPPTPPDGGEVAPPAAPRRTRAARTRAAYDADFEAAWTAYPSRGEHGNSKAAAFRQYVARRRAGVTAAELLAATAGYARYVRSSGKAGSETVMMASTFYGRDLRYLDYVPKPAAPSTTPALRPGAPPVPEPPRRPSASPEKVSDILRRMTHGTAAEREAAAAEASAL